MLFTKEQAKKLKKRYPRKTHKLLVKILKSQIFGDETSLCEFLDIIKNYSPNDLKYLKKLINNYPNLTIEMTIANILPTEITYYINTFGEDLLSKNFYEITQLDLTNTIIQKFLSEIYNNDTLLWDILNNRHKIEYAQTSQIPADLIINKFQRYSEIFYDNYDNQQVISLLELDEESYKKFCEFKPLAAKIPYNIKSYIINFLLTNHEYIDIFNKELKENENFNLTFLLRKTNNQKLFNAIFLSLLNSDLSFNDKKNILMNKFFYADIIRVNLNDMLNHKKNENYMYSNEINTYLKVYEKLLNITNEQELYDFYNNYKNYTFFSLEEIKECIIVEYNKHLNSLLTKEIDIKNNPNVTISEEEYTSKIYFENIEFKTPQKKKIQIYTLHNVEFIALMHGLVPKEQNDFFKELHNYSQELYKKPNLWTSAPEFGTNYISLSLNRHDSFALFGIAKILFGINEISNTQIKTTNRHDNATDMSAGTTIENTINLLAPEILTEPQFNSTRPNYIYNECVSTRDGIIPNYLIVANTPNMANIPLLTDETKEWALYYDIPIYVIDCKSYYETYYNQFLEYQKSLMSCNKIPTNEEINHLFYLISTANQYSPILIGNTFDILASLINIDYSNLTEEDIYNLENILYKRMPEYISDVYGSTYLENSYNLTKVDQLKLEELLRSRAEFVEKLQFLIAERKQFISKT